MPGPGPSQAEHLSKADLLIDILNFKRERERERERKRERERERGLFQ
jgi:hypothetical protein